MKTIVALFLLVLSINALVLNKELAIQLVSDENDNGFLCFVRKNDPADNYGTAYIRTHFLPPKVSQITPLAEIPMGVTNAKGCTIATYNNNGTFHLLAVFENTFVIRMTVWHATYSVDALTNTIIIDTPTMYEQPMENTPFSFSVPLYPRIFVLDNAIFVYIMGMYTIFSDYRVCYYYYPNLNAFTQGSYTLTPLPTNMPNYRIGNWDYYSTYIQNGVLKTSVALTRYPFGSCAINTCANGLLFHEVNSANVQTNATFKVLGGLNFGADMARPLPYEAYHDTADDPSGAVTSIFLSYKSYLFTYSATSNPLSQLCHWLAADTTVTRYARVLANDAMIYNGNWFIVYIDGLLTKEYIPKLLVAPTYWTGDKPYYYPNTLWNISILPISLSSDYVDRSEFGLFKHKGRIYLTYVNANKEADIYTIL